MAAISHALLARGPTWSIEGARGITPYLLTRPYVGLSPKMPQSDDGTLIEPLVSVPMAARDIPALTATAEPPLEPPDILLGSQGFIDEPKCGLILVMPHANS